jgi:beta-glucanase (GH16 family)
MNKLICVFLCFSAISTAQKTNYKLVWEEQFVGSQLDESIWNFELGNGCPNLCGWGNNELQVYTKNNHFVKDGYLTIIAKKVDGQYSSTRITTKSNKEFKYGRIETRAKLPIGKGIWPAFWMLGSNISEVGWPKCGEIDILEYIGKEPDVIFTSLHTQASHGNTINTKKTKIETIEEGFHIYAVDWNEQKMDFFVDEKLVYTFNPQLKNEYIWPFDKNFFIIINMAIGGNFGGPEVDNSIFPQEFIIDYIKVYQ